MRRSVRAPRLGLLMVPLVGAALCIVFGTDHLGARTAGGVLVAIGLLAQVARLLIALRAGQVASFWIRLATAEVLSLSLGAWYYANHPAEVVLIVVSVVLLGAGVWLGRMLPRSVSAIPYTANLPGAPRMRPEMPRRRYGWYSIVLSGVWTLGFVAGLVQLPALVLLALVLVGLALMAVIAVPLLRYAAAHPKTFQALRALAPAYVMPYNGFALFHIGMWSPYIERAGKPFYVLTTNRETFERLSTAYTLPIVCPADSSPVALAAVLPSSVQAAFYVHNGRNKQFFGHRRMTHVFLHHGDGDKPASSNPVSNRYDALVVAGQAAIDRYARRGVKVPLEKFHILGRPQTEAIRTVHHPISAVSDPVILYAPTWCGSDESANFSSLHLGVPIVQALLDRGGTVIFRPHPAGRNHEGHARAIREIKALLAADHKQTGRSHVWGKQAESTWSVADVSNQADAMIADVSGIVTDFMQTLKPFAMVATKSDTHGFREEYPSSQSAYVIEGGDLSTLDGALDQMLGEDPLAEVRTERRRYYLGGFDADESARAFVDYVRSLAP